MMNGAYGSFLAQADAFCVELQRQNDARRFDFDAAGSRGAGRWHAPGVRWGEPAGRGLQRLPGMPSS